MKAGYKILIPDCYGGYNDDVFTIEIYRHCLGIFESSAHREAGMFTPLCSLYEAGPDSETKYISNFGEYKTNKVQAWIYIGDDK